MNAFIADMSCCKKIIFRAIGLFLSITLGILGYSNLAFAKYPNPPCISPNTEYADVELTDHKYPTYLPERENYNPSENPGFLSNYLNRCRPCRTCIAMTDDDMCDGSYEKTCENRICPPNPYDVFTYFGFNYKQFWVPPINDWPRLFVKNNPGFNFYFGARMYTFFGVEFGYEWTANKPIATLIEPGTSILGIVNTNPFPVRLSAKQRLRSGYIDFNLFIPVLITHCFQPEAIMSIGWAAVRPSVRIQAFPNAEPYRTQLLHLNGRGKNILRVGLGVQTLIINNIGMRFMWQWQNTSTLKFQQSPVAYAPATRHIFKNANTLSGGIYFYF